jgi:hypothetical protein
MHGVVEPVGIAPTAARVGSLAAALAGPTLRVTDPESRFAGFESMAEPRRKPDTSGNRGGRVTEATGDVDSTFKATIRRMLETPPKPHGKGKTKGAAPKGDPRSSGKGSKS